MAELSTASDLPHYAPFTGREPQLKAAGPVWVIQIHGDVPEPQLGEIWTDPVCVVTSTDFGYFATGIVTKTATGETFKPEQPPSAPDRALPSLAP